MAGSASLVVNSTTFTDLGVAPTQIQVIGVGPVTVVVADSLPSAGTVGFILQGNQGNPLAPIVIAPADSTSHTYVAQYGGVASAIVYSIVYGSVA